MNNTNLLKTVLFSIIICLVAPMISHASNSNILGFTLPSGLPNYNEIYMQGIGSTLYINTEITGKVVVAREIKADKSLGKKY